MPKENEFDMFFTHIPFSLIGIVSPLSNFQIAYRLQQNLDCEFEKTNDFAFYKPKLKKELHFSCLLQVNVAEGLSYMLWDNIAFGSSYCLIDRLKKIDYLFLVIGRDFDTITKNICNNIKKIPNVTLAQIFYPFSEEGSGKSILKPNIIEDFMSSIGYFKDNNDLMNNIYI